MSPHPLLIPSIRLARELSLRSHEVAQRTWASGGTGGNVKLFDIIFVLVFIFVSVVVVMFFTIVFILVFL
jgi:hypothetical protein